MIVTALGLVGDVRSIRALVASLSDDDFAVREAAKGALGRMARGLTRVLADGLRREAAMAALAEIGEPAVWPTAHVLWDASLGLFAATVLARIGEPAWFSRW